MIKDKVIYGIFGGAIVATSIFVAVSINNSNKYVNDLKAKTETTIMDKDDFTSNKNINVKNKELVSYFSKINLKLNNISSNMGNSNPYFKIYLNSRDEKYLDEYIKMNEDILSSLREMQNIKEDSLNKNLDVVYVNEKLKLLEEQFVNYITIFKDLKSNSTDINNKTLNDINAQSFEIANNINLANELTKRLTNAYKLPFELKKGFGVVNKENLKTCNNDILDIMSTMTLTDNIFSKNFNPSPNMIDYYKDINLKYGVNSAKELNKLFQSSVKNKEQLKTVNDFINNAVDYTESLDNYLDNLKNGEFVSELKSDKANLLKKRELLNQIYQSKLTLIQIYNSKNN